MVYDIERRITRGEYEGLFSVEARSRSAALAIAKRRLAGGSFSRGRIRAVPRSSELAETLRAIKARYSANPSCAIPSHWTPARVRRIKGGRVQVALRATGARKRVRGRRRP
jgi:hypothetical protein